MKDLPAEVSSFSRTREFSEDSVPDKLRNDHRTAAGVWGRIVVLEGRLHYRILEPEIEDTELSPGLPGIVEPGVTHVVKPLGKVRFYVEFLR